MLTETTVNSGRSTVTRDPSLWMSLAASLVVHAIALAVFAGLLLPMPSSVSAKLGVPTVVQVLLVEARQAEKAPEPATTVEPAPPLAAIAPALTPLPAPSPKEPPPDPPVPVRRIDLSTPAAHATGAPVASDSTPDATLLSTPLPEGDVAVGPAKTAEVMGRAQALRLAQRYPERVTTAPQLQFPLVVPYPPRAARAHREGRIAALLIIDANGSALEATLSPDDPLFGPTVEDALRSARFRPAEVDGKPVAHWLVLEFVFTMRPAAPSRSAR